MKAPWTSTIVLGALGLLAAPFLLSAPSLIRDSWAEPALRPFVIFLSIAFLLSVLWLIFLLRAVFRHRGRTRTLLLVLIATVFLSGVAIEIFGPKTTTAISVDLPPPAQPAKP